MKIILSTAILLFLSACGMTSSQPIKRGGGEKIVCFDDQSICQEEAARVCGGPFQIVNLYAKDRQSQTVMHNKDAMKMFKRLADTVVNPFARMQYTMIVNCTNNRGH